MNYDDPTWRLVDVYVWTVLEDSVGITSACLPTMREHRLHIMSDHWKTNHATGPLFGRFLPGVSRAESSNKKNSGSSSQRAVRARFDRLFEESGTEIASQGIATEREDAWTSPDLEASNELSSMNKALVKPLQAVDSSSRMEDHHHRVNYTRRATYE